MRAALHRSSPQPDVGGPDGGRLQPGPDGQIGSKPGLKTRQGLIRGEGVFPDG